MSVYNKIIKIQKLDLTTEQWNDYCIAHANINKASGKEYFNARTEISNSTFNFTIRYNPSLGETIFNTEIYRIIYENKIFDIKKVDDFMLKHKELIIVGDFNGKYNNR